MPTPEGILNLDKPRGPTSHDVVNHVRALTGIRRVGHAGTLDPLATGVLIICIGRATRVSEYLMGGQKVYQARVRLGVTTDTYDAEGQIVARSPLKVEREQIEAALSQFRGQIIQTPPVYSALKHQGTSLHRLARQGVDVKEIAQRKARQVEITQLALVDWDIPHVLLEVTCSSGTYIRSLAHDVGQVLGCGAHLTELTRLASGSFHLDNAIPLEQFARAAEESRWLSLLHPLDAALTHFPPLHLDVESARRLCSGQAVTAPSPGCLSGEETEEVLARAYGPGDIFLALAAHDPATDLWRPRKVFCDPERFS